MQRARDRDQRFRAGMSGIALETCNSMWESRAPEHSTHRRNNAMKALPTAGCAWVSLNGEAAEIE
jgi:hypothetical protein